MILDIIEKAGIFVILLSLAAGLFAYPTLPEQVASHWNIAGEADGYLPKNLGVFLLPAVSAVLFALLVLLPKIDPLRANIEAFRQYYHGFILVIVSFLLILQLLVIFWNLGFMFDFGRVMPVLLGSLFFYLGIMLEKSRRNWFIGIRTPWTLSSDAVWERTHNVGGKVFKATGIVMMLSALLPSEAFFIIIGLAVASTLGTAAYSYFVFRDLSKKKSK